MIIGTSRGTESFSFGQFTLYYNSNNSIGISNDKLSISYTGGYVNDTIGTSYRRQSSTTTNSTCTGNNSSNMRTIASYTTHQFVQPSYGTSLIDNSVSKQSDTRRIIHVNSGAATDALLWMVMYSLCHRNTFFGLHVERQEDTLLVAP